jgi:hypothetical protein
MRKKDKRLTRRHLIAFAQSVIEELNLSNNEVTLHLYGGKKVCPDCKEQHLFIDRFCPECGILSSSIKEAA